MALTDQERADLALYGAIVGGDRDARGLDLQGLDLRVRELDERTRMLARICLRLDDELGH